MTRSLYKGPFIDNKLLLKFINSKKNKLTSIYTRSRSSTITFDFINSTIYVYNGKKYFPLSIKQGMVGYKLGDFVFTKKKMIFKKKKKKGKNK